MPHKKSRDPKATRKRINQTRWQSQAGPGKWVNKLNADKLRRLREQQEDDE